MMSLQEIIELLNLIFKLRNIKNYLKSKGKDEIWFDEWFDDEILEKLDEEQVKIFQKIKDLSFLISDIEKPRLSVEKIYVEIENLSKEVFLNRYMHHLMKLNKINRIKSLDKRIEFLEGWIAMLFGDFTNKLRVQIQEIDNYPKSLRYFKFTYSEDLNTYIKEELTKSSIILKEILERMEVIVQKYPKKYKKGVLLPDFRVLLKNKKDFERVYKKEIVPLFNELISWTKVSFILMVLAYCGRNIRAKKLESILNKKIDRDLEIIKRNLDNFKKSFII